MAARSKAPTALDVPVASVAAIVDSADRGGASTERGSASTSRPTGADTGASKGPRLLDLADMEEEARNETGGPVLTIPGNDQIVDEERIQDVYMAMTKEVRSLAAKVCEEYSSDKIGDLQKILSDALLAADIKTFNVDLKSVDQSQEQVQVTGRASLPWGTRPCHLSFLPRMLAGYGGHLSRDARRAGRSRGLRRERSGTGRVHVQPGRYHAGHGPQVRFIGGKERPSRGDPEQELPEEHCRPERGARVDLPVGACYPVPDPSGLSHTSCGRCTPCSICSCRIL